MRPPSLEILIPTLNEAEQIRDAVANAAQLGPVFVLDSFSTDGTQDLARQAGATVVEHAFENYAAQKNWGLENLPLAGEWIVILDADERITPALREEIRELIASDPHEDGFYINRQPIFMGKRIRHGGLYPSWNLRLFRRGRASYENRRVHEHMICPGPTGYLRGQLVHIRYETIAQYIAKHIRYADLESDEWLSLRVGQSRAASADSLFSSTLRCRQWLRRRVWPRLPGRPLWRFIYMYFFRLGFLDGRAGWHLAWLMACYEYMISLLYDQKRRAKPGDPTPEVPAITTASEPPAAWHDGPPSDAVDSPNEAHRS